MTRQSHSVFDGIIYAQCWEDPDLDRAAFRITPEDTIFSITSGGCNTLAFLIDNPKEIFALDCNPRQNFVLDLKMGGFAALSYDELLEFVGVRDSQQRAGMYAAVRPYLRRASRHFWDERQPLIAAGLLHAGRYEGYMKLLRKWLRRIKGERLIHDLFAANDPCERARLYRTAWDTPLWRLFTRMFLSRAMMSFLFTDDFFRYVEGSFSFGRHFSAMVGRALTAPSLQDNYFASYILLGRYFDEEHLPPYLQRGNYSVIRARCGRVRLITGSCEQFFERCPASSVQKFNFTNIFEWMSPEAFASLLRQTWRVGSDGAVLTYRNLLVFRERPAALEAMITQDRDAARLLLARDRSFVYRNYVVETIRKESIPWNTKSARSGIAVS